jgi:hypothetical protein
MRVISMILLAPTATRPSSPRPEQKALTAHVRSGCFQTVPLELFLLFLSGLTAGSSPDRPTNIPPFSSCNSGRSPRNKRTPFRNQRFFSSPNLRKPRSSRHLVPPVRMRRSGFHRPLVPPDCGDVVCGDLARCMRHGRCGLLALAPTTTSCGCDTKCAGEQHGSTHSSGASANSLQRSPQLPSPPTPPIQNPNSDMSRTPYYFSVCELRSMPCIVEIYTALPGHRCPGRQGHPHGARRRRLGLLLPA